MLWVPPSPLYSYTPLMEAAREGHEDVVQLLVEHGANVNAQTEETQETALTLAACGGFIEVAQYLIEHGECSTWICLPVSCRFKAFSCGTCTCTTRNVGIQFITILHSKHCACACTCKVYIALVFRLVAVFSLWQSFLFSHTVCKVYM